MIAAVLTFWMTRRLLRPLHELGAATEKIASGEYDYRVPTDRGDEFGELAIAFNAMAESLDHNERLRRSMVVTPR